MGDLASAAARLVRLVIVHVPPRRRGLRLATISERFFGQPTGPLRARHLSGYTITCQLRDPVQRSLFYRGTYEPVTTSLIARALAAGDTFLDVGANVGHYTFLAADIVGPDGTVHAVEASTETVQALRDDIVRNGLEPRITVHAIAAGDSSDRLVLRGSGGSGEAGTRHLDPKAKTDPIEETVEVMPLDDALGDVSPSVVKVDVEGADLRALVGMRRMIERARPRLIVAEAEEEQLARFGDSVPGLVSYMGALGYRAEPIADEGHANGIAFWSDT